MIHPLPFANALAATTAVLAVLLIALRVAAPTAFQFVFNAQFFGADVAALLPAQMDPTKILGEIVAFVGGAWGFGLLGAVIYNRLIAGRHR